MPRWVVWLGAAIGVIVVVAGAFLVWPREESAVTEHEAVEEYRSKTADRQASDSKDSRSGERGRPEPGVYTYSSTGEESVKLGPLPAEERTYPDTMTVTIVDEGTACFTSKLNLLDQHTEETTYCPSTDGALRIQKHLKHQQVGALKPTATMTCDPDQLVAKGSKASELACSMSLSGGPVTVNAELAGTTEVDEATLTIAGKQVGTQAVDATFEISGPLSGTWKEKIWFTDDWLPVRIERDFDFNGIGSFEETSTLELTSTKPKR